MPGTDEANPRPGSHPRPPREDGARRTASLRARQMVSRRAVPRWALSCYWRVDGVPVWEDIDLIAREDQEYGFGAADAFEFMEALTRRLQVSFENMLPAYNREA